MFVQPDKIPNANKVQRTIYHWWAFSLYFRMSFEAGGPASDSACKYVSELTGGWWKA